MSLPIRYGYPDETGCGVPSHRPTGASVSQQGTHSRPVTTGLRTRVVWGVLVASMTLVGGMLLLLDGGPSPRLDGFSLVPMVSTSEYRSINAIFDTRRDLEPWGRIVIHHSATPVATPATIAADARTRYHFIIGNGRGMNDGEVHVTYRWLEQQPAGIEPDDAIVICLVGDGNRRLFTPTQIRRLEELVVALDRRLGIPHEQVLFNSDPDRPAGPGRFFPSAMFRQRIASGL